MRKYIKLFFIGSLLCTILGFTSCELESEVYDSISENMFPKTESDAESLVTANAYGVFMSNGYKGIFNAARGPLLVSDMMTDCCECTWRGWWNPILYCRWVPEDEMVWTHWIFVPYMGKMTMTLDRIQNMSIPEKRKNQFLAELHCARGWLAFLMYDLYGPIPIADIETLKDPLAEKIIPRLSEEEMQKFIVDELTIAADVLPYNYVKGDPNFGRFTKGLCNTILMKFYMQQKQWDKAEALGRELIDPKYGYKLEPDYANIFTLANEKNAETIWAVNCKRGTQEHKWHPHVLPNDYPGTESLTKWNGFKITWDFFNTFEEGDKRLETIIYDYVSSDGIRHNQEEDTKSADKLLYYGAVPCKYDCKDFAGTLGEDSETDYIVYRYADVLTLLSEAIVRNGEVVTQEAVDLLNSVRTRAGLKAYSISDFSGVRDFLDKLLLERSHELFFEGCRRQDLIRDDSFISAIKKKAERAGQKTFVNENYYRIPLPQWVINEGKGKITQNPGY